MIRFLHPIAFLLFIPIVLFAIYSIYRISRIRKDLRRFGETALVKDLMPELSLRRKQVKDIILILSLAFMVLALARPQMGGETEKIKKKGIEVMVCMDISNSMYAQDVKPSRLAVAKGIVGRMVDKMSDDKVGLILFAGEAFVQLPLTSDMVSAKMFLDSANPSMMEIQGTAIGQAINLASRSFDSNDKVKKAIVLITDGEDHDGSVESAVKAANAKGIMVNIIGVGTAEGAPIPLPEGDYLKDPSGQLVVTKLNVDMCQQIAGYGDGLFIQGKDIHNTSRNLIQGLDKLQKSEFESTVYSSYNEKYYYFLIPALLLLILDFLLLDRKNRYLKRIKLFGDEEK